MSPSGVLCFSMRIAACAVTRGQGFRPLPGFCVSQLKLTGSEKQIAWGFRPLPGFCVSQLCGLPSFNHAPVRVSVPFRGSVFLNRWRDDAKTKRLVSVPFRGSVFLNEYKQVLAEFCRVSVPFRGSVFLNFHKINWSTYQSCFRPLPGFCVSQLNFATTIAWDASSFRPLPGFCVSQWRLQVFRLN